MAKQESVVDTVLSHYGMVWKLNPYQIVNKHGIIVQKHSFDLREKVLKSQENIGFKGHLFRKTYPSIKSTN